MTLAKDGLTINLPSEQAIHKYSLGKKNQSFSSLMDGHTSSII